MSGALQVSTSVAERNLGPVAVNEARRPRVVMMCGPGGAGKTTYAKRLEREGWTRLSFEVEFWDRGITTMRSAEVVGEVAANLKARLLRHVAAGNDVVLDFGFWFRRQRDEFRELLAPQGILPETVCIATSLETILSRVGDRHGRGADDWPLSEQTATEYFERIEDVANECGYPSDPSKFSSLDTRTNETYRLVVLFLAYTGVRFGEMAALRVARLDVQRRRAVIAESVTPVQGKGLVWGTTKTHQRRDVPIPRFLTAELAEHIKDKGVDELVFGGIRNGQPLRVATFRKSFDAAAAVIGVPDLHPHQLRHAAASLAIASGADVKVVQQMLGHASATMTLDTYGHLFEDRLNEVGDAMDAARTAARERRAEASAVARVSKLCPNGPETRNEGTAPTSISAGQSRVSDGYPRPDSNRRYRLESPKPGLVDDVGE